MKDWIFYTLVTFILAYPFAIVYCFAKLAPSDEEYRKSIRDAGRAGYALGSYMRNRKS